MLLCVGELFDDGQGNFLAACKPPGDNAWVPWFHAHARPHSRMWQEDGPPIPTDVCLRDDLLGVMFGTMIDNKIENTRRKLWGSRCVRASSSRRFATRRVAVFNTRYNSWTYGEWLEDGLGKRADAN